MMKLLNLILITFLIGSASIFAQTTTLTYQGRLTDNSSSASGTYQMRFSLFDANSGGTQIGSTIEQTSVSVSNGIFTVALDFGATAFSNGANRFLEIEVRRNSGETYTPLTPRQQVTSTPYSIRSLSTDTATNSTQLGGVNASQYVLTTDSRLSDARTPTAGSNNYVQNTTSSQMGANFNIGGTGTANIFDAATQYNIGGTRVFSAPGTSTFLGRNAGINNVLSGSTGYRNVFVGNNAGFGNTNGYYNTFIGDRAGEANTTAISNTFVGSGVGLANMTGANNSFFGNFTGVKNQTGGSNSFFGTNAGFENVSGGFNTFIGGNSGAANTNGGSNLFLGYSSASGNTTGSRNTFVGTVSGGTNVAGNDNTLLGYNAETGNSSLSFATAIGSGAVAATSNTIQLGRNGSDVVRVGTLGAATPTYLCVNANNILSACSVDSSQYVVTTDPRLSDARTPTAGSSNYIQNTNVPQTGANFNVGGTGTANSLNSLSSYKIGGLTVLGIPGNDNTFIGEDAGAVNSSGSNNTFVGSSSGERNTTGISNVFFGRSAGNRNTSGDFNVFIGNNAGFSNTFAEGNVFIGNSSGGLNTSGNENVFIGASAANQNKTGSSNAFFGALAGGFNTIGRFNTFIGHRAGYSNISGSSNTLLGQNADVASSALVYATSVGADSRVSTSNTIVLGRTSDRTNVSGVFNVLNGRTSPVERGNVNLLANSGNLNLYMQGGGNGNGINFGVSSPATGNATLFIAQYNGVSYQDRMRINATGAVEIRQLGSAGSTALCRNSLFEISACSSSIRYKSNVKNFSNGISIIKKLRPVSFNWTEGGMLDFGLVAEEVFEVEPLLTTQNTEGKTEGVKYDRIGVVLVNAVNEQQIQIEEQKTANQKLQTQIEKQQQQINELKQIVCPLKPDAEVCQEVNQ